MPSLLTAHGPLALPAFLPDATRGAVRTLDAADVAACGIEALMVNALHLSTQPGASAVGLLGGIHWFMGWDRPIASDSGGFQAFSLATGREKLGTISQDGFTYRLDKGAPKKLFTPEKCIQRQFQLGADILFCLDYCTHPNADGRTQRESVDYTVQWAQRCKAEFERRVAGLESEEPRPLLFAVVQGGADRALRRECAERLLDIGFDGYGYGGWPVDERGRLAEMVAHVAELIPASFPRHALGIGKPENLVQAYRLGYALFDCTLPTRDARHKRLYVSAGQPGKAGPADRKFYRCLDLGDCRYARDGRPLDDTCDCHCCATASRAYVHHLFEAGDPLACRLATVHNLRFYARLMQHLQTECSDE